MFHKYDIYQNHLLHHLKEFETPEERKLQETEIEDEGELEEEEEPFEVPEGATIVRPGSFDDPDEVYYVTPTEYDRDFYYRMLPPINYKSCAMPGITSSLCIPAEDIKN